MQQESASVTIPIKAWSGDLAHLDRLRQIIDSLLSEKAQQLITQAKERGALKEAQLRKENTDGLGRKYIEVDIAYLSAELTDQIERIKTEWQCSCKATYSDFGRIVTGTAESILAGLDVRGLLSLVFKSDIGYRTPGYDLQLSLSIKRGEWRANELRIEAPDIGWLHSAKSQLETELKKNRPWWWFIPTPLAAHCWAAFLFLAVFAPILATHKWSATVTAGDLTLIWDSMWVPVGGSFLTYLMVKWLLPAFTIHAEASIGQHRLRIAALIATVGIQVVIAAVVPLLGLK